METDQARVLVTTLIAAFPQATLEPASAELYVAAIAELENADIAAESVKMLVKHSRTFPSIAEVRDQYIAYLNRVPLRGQIEEAVAPPPPEALEAIRGLAEKWDSPGLAAFADRIEAGGEG
jgi:hypothetical protein